MKGKRTTNAVVEGHKVQVLGPVNANNNEMFNAADRNNICPIRLQQLHHSIFRPPRHLNYSRIVR